MRAERYLDAQICCQQALTIDPGRAEALHLMGLLSLHADRYDHAVEWMSRAIAQDPKPEYLFSLGTALQHQTRYEEALQVFDKAVQLKPDKAELWTGLGKALVDLGRRAEALLSFQHALKLNPNNWEAAHENGMLLNKLGRREEALTCFKRCVELRPKRASDEALAFNNLGNVLQSLGRSEEALRWLDRALDLRPDFVQALSNKAIALSQMWLFDQAFEVYARVKALDPNHAVSNWNSALLHMLTGNFEAVDTSVAHLAGALGCPTWILLPYTPDYRWLLDRDDSPWYPTVRLFRQHESRDYGPVIARVRAELAAMISRHNGQKRKLRP
jgi:tetratricopeptide (TPR) repeat protein